MKTWLAILAAVVLVNSTVRAATIVGTIRAEGKEGADSAALGGKYDSRQLKFAEKVDYGDLRDFIVYLEGNVGSNAPAASAVPMQVVTTRKINQKGAVFTPHVVPVLVGTTVEWPNEDDIYHNVFSYSEARPFDLGLYKHPEVKRVTFDRPGRVDVFCSIHKAMNCIVLVLDNPFFAVCDSRGRYTISDVPAGTYRIKVWHERLPPLVKEINVPATGEVRLDLVMGIINLPKY